MLDLAKKHKKQVRTISLGQGQEPAARKLISTGVAQGSWVMLQNCHLGLKFMAEVETTMLKLDDIEPGFQLWITTEPHPKFPIGLLQMSIKVTNEVRSPPPYRVTCVRTCLAHACSPAYLLAYLLACLLAYLFAYLLRLRPVCAPGSSRPTLGSTRTCWTR